MVTNEQLCISTTIAQFYSWSCWTPRCWGSWDIQPASRTTCSREWWRHRNKAWHRRLKKLWQHSSFGFVAREHSLLHHPVSFYPWVFNILRLNIQPLDKSGLGHLYRPNWSCPQLRLEAVSVPFLLPLKKPLSAAGFRGWASPLPLLHCCRHFLCKIYMVCP